MDVQKMKCCWLMVLMWYGGAGSVLKRWTLASILLLSRAASITRQPRSSRNHLQEDDGLGPIVRVRKREKNIERGLASVIGYLSTLAAWVGGDLATPEADISLVLRWLYGAGLDYLDEKERDFSKRYSTSKSFMVL